MSAEQYQNILDEYKENIPDGLYKKLCDLNMIKHKEDEQVWDFYDIHYFIPKHRYNINCYPEKNTISIEKRIIIKKLTKKQYNSIKTKIDENDFSNRFFDHNIDNENIEIKNIIRPNHEEDDEDYVDNDYNVSHLVKIELQPLVYKIELSSST